MPLFLKTLICEWHLSFFFRFALFIIISIVCLANLTNTKLISNRSSFIGLNAKPVFFDIFSMEFVFQFNYDEIINNFHVRNLVPEKEWSRWKFANVKNVICHLKPTMASITWISNEWLLTSRMKTVCLYTWFLQLKHMPLDWAVIMALR